MKKNVESTGNSFLFLGISIVSFSGSFFLSKLIVGIIRNLFPMLSQPPSVEQIRKKYVWNISEFVTEKLENSWYLIFVLLICCIALILGLLLRKSYKLTPLQAEHHTLSSIARWASIAILFIFSILAVWRVFHLGEYTAKYMSITTHPILTISLWLIVMIVALWRIGERNTAFFQRAVVLRIVSIFFVLMILFFSFLQYSGNFSNGHYAGTFSVLFHPVYEISQGASLGITTRSLYGFYPYVLYFIQRCFLGQVTPEYTAFLLVAIGAQCNIIIYHIVSKLAKSKILGFLSVMSLLFVSQLYASVIDVQVPYYQYNPIRMLGPIITLFVLFKHIECKEIHKKIWFIVSLAFCGFSLFWNPDTGIVCCIVVLAYNVYAAFQKTR